MGFMDKLGASAKKAAQQAQMGMGGGGMIEYRNRAMKLNQAGVNHHASIVSASETGRTDPGGGQEVELTVDVQPEAGTPYQATFTQFLVGASVGSLTAGAGITVRVDPDDPQSMLFWGMSA